MMPPQDEVARYPIKHLDNIFPTKLANIFSVLTICQMLFNCFKCISHLIILRFPWRRHCYPHFTDKKTEAEKSYITCQTSNMCWMIRSKSNPGQWGWGPRSYHLSTLLSWPVSWHCSLYPRHSLKKGRKVQGVCSEHRHTMAQGAHVGGHTNGWVLAK